MLQPLKIIKDDPWLNPYTPVITSRNNKYLQVKKRLLNYHNSISDFASGHHYYGIHKTSSGWAFREYAPNATSIYLIGDFNNWQISSDYEMTRVHEGNWELELTDDKVHEGDKFKLIIMWPGGQGERLPSYCWYALQDDTTKLFDAVITQKNKFNWQHKSPAKEIKTPLIYEAHIGMATEEQKVGSYLEFCNNILPRIKDAGYNTVQLMAIQEHPYYGSFGYHVSNFFAASSRFGTPNDLKQLIDTAHSMGLMVIMDLIHSHAVKNELEGLGNFDGKPDIYFHTGNRREHIAWDSLCFDYGKEKVMHFLLSNCRFWLEEYHFDGFRFDGITSMLYYDHGLERSFNNYDAYYDGGEDEDAITYLSLANELIHDINPHAITIAEEMSGMPGIAEKQAGGGIGFDFRLAMGMPDYWIKIIKERKDEEWQISEMFHELTSRREHEKTISYAESHDQALVGDKTIIFRLIDQEMYWHMNKSARNLAIDRGLALHKMIRLISFATNGGGYLNFMGNEFGHPEWIDFPRQGNNWSYKYARRQWSLADNKELKYHFLGDFDRDMLQIQKNTKFLEHEWCNKISENSGDQVLAFSRGDLIFVFNFNPSKSFSDYGISTRAGRYNIILCTDSTKYGGFGNVDEQIIYLSERIGGTAGNDWLRIYIPSRSAIVFQKKKTASVV